MSRFLRSLAITSSLALGCGEVQDAEQAPSLVETPPRAQEGLTVNFRATFDDLMRWPESHSRGAAPVEPIVPEITPPQESKEIPVGKENFDSLVAYIEGRGFVVRADEVRCDRQVTFFDSTANRHAMITIKRDENGQPSAQGSVEQISVWAYRDGIVNQEQAFSYIITEDGIRPNPESLDGGWAERAAVERGYQEFLAKVQAASKKKK